MQCQEYLKLPGDQSKSKEERDGEFERNIELLEREFLDETQAIKRDRRNSLLEKLRVRSTAWNMLSLTLIEYRFMALMGFEIQSFQPIHLQVSMICQSVSE